MRMRKKRNRDVRMEECAALLAVEPYPKGEWRGVFGNGNPIRLEIGCGKGSFVTQMAQRCPDVNFIAVEKCPDVLLLAMEKTRALKLANIRFIGGDAGLLGDILSPGEVERIYVNFCDPWPKAKQAKRRLTHRNFLNIYKTLLSPNGGELHFKTDNRGLFLFSLSEMKAAGLERRNVTHDLHASDFPDNVVTEYEALFSGQGMPIYRCEAVFPPVRDFVTETDAAEMIQ